MCSACVTHCHANHRTYVGGYTRFYCYCPFGVAGNVCEWCAGGDDTDRKTLPPAAQRALAEAEERRRKEKSMEQPRELGGRGGPEPTRYGDWERKGICSDF